MTLILHLNICAGAILYHLKFQKFLRTLKDTKFHTNVIEIISPNKEKKKQ